MNTIIIVISFIVSMILAIAVMRKKKSKWYGLFFAFMINVIILGAAYCLLWNADEESRLFGIDFQDRHFLIVFIPIITYLNYIVMSFVKNRESKARV